MPDSFRNKLVNATAEQFMDKSLRDPVSWQRAHFQRLIRAGYSPDAVRGILCLQPTDKLWGEVQSYYEERKSKHGNSNG